LVNTEYLGLVSTEYRLPRGLVAHHISGLHLHRTAEVILHVRGPVGGEGALEYHLEWGLSTWERG